MAGAASSERGGGYHRDQLSWVMFAALLAFGVLNAGLGPALPYLRTTEHVSYLGGVLHQMAFAVGGGFAGLLAARVQGGIGRRVAICGGLGGAAVAWLGVGYGAVLAATVAAAFFVSLLGTSALVRLWAVLADMHGSHRAVAMTEGEVSVSLGGIVAPLLIGALAATALTWRAAFFVGAAIVGVAALACGAARLPSAISTSVQASSVNVARSGQWLSATLIVVFAVVGLEFSLAFWLASYLVDDVGVARRLAVVMVSVLYAANLAGRLAASRLARRLSTERVLSSAIVLSLAGLPILLLATSVSVAAIGLALAGVGIGATFPLTSSLHVAASARNADSAIGQVLAAAAIGQVVGPLSVAALAQAFNLRIGLLTLPVLALLAAGALSRHSART